MLLQSARSCYVTEFECYSNLPELPLALSHWLFAAKSADIFACVLMSDVAQEIQFIRCRDSKRVGSWCG